MILQIVVDFKGIPKASLCWRIINAQLISHVTFPCRFQNPSSSKPCGVSLTSPLFNKCIASLLVFDCFLILRVLKSSNQYQAKHFCSKVYNSYVFRFSLKCAFLGCASGHMCLSNAYALCPHNTISVSGCSLGLSKPLRDALSNLVGC